MIFKLDRKSVKEEPLDRGIVYLLVMDLDERQVIKIGMTKRKRVDDRVAEILLAMWHKYRYIPRTVVARYSTVDKPLDMEQELLRYFSEYSVDMEHSFGGSKEFIQHDIALVKEKYDELLPRYKAH